MPPWVVPVIGAIAVVASAVIGGLVTWLATRSKTKAETVKLLTDSCNGLAAQVNAGVTALTVATATIEREVREKKLFGAQAADAESKLAKCLGVMATLNASAELIAENVRPLSFVPTGPPTEHDESAIRRLKIIRDTAQQMQDAINGNDNGKGS